MTNKRSELNTQKQILGYTKISIICYKSVYYSKYIIYNYTYAI
jgi:hypothetical protein